MLLNCRTKAKAKVWPCVPASQTRLTNVSLLKLEWMLPFFMCPKMHVAMLAWTRWLPTPGPLELRYKMDYVLSAKGEVWHSYHGPWIICSYLGPGVMDASNISLHVLIDRWSLLHTETGHYAFRVQMHAINHNPCIHGHDMPKWSVHMDAMHAYITHMSAVILPNVWELCVFYHQNMCSPVSVSIMPLTCACICVPTWV